MEIWIILAGTLLLLLFCFLPELLFPPEPLEASGSAEAAQSLEAREEVPGVSNCPPDVKNPPTKHKLTTLKAFNTYHRRSRPQQVHLPPRKDENIEAMLESFKKTVYMNESKQKFLTLLRVEKVLSSGPGDNKVELCNINSKRLVIKTLSRGKRDDKKLEALTKITHNALIKTYGYISLKTLIIVMEYFPGPTLKSYVEECENATTARPYVLNALNVLGYLNGMGIVLGTKLEEKILCGEGGDIRILGLDERVYISKNKPYAELVKMEGYLGLLELICRLFDKDLNTFGKRKFLKALLDEVENKKLRSHLRSLVSENLIL